MKKLIICLLAITVTLSSFSQSFTNENYGVRKINTGSAITSLVVNDKISVVLLDNASNEITIEGDKSAIELYSMELKGSDLTITNNSNEERTAAIVYVPAKLMKHISINGASAISSYETLHNKSITVLMNGVSKFWVKTFGKVTVKAADGYDYTYVSRPLSK